MSRQEPDKGKITLNARGRVPSTEDAGAFRVVNHEMAWDPSKTAVIVCDMWDRHWCDGATRRVAELAPSVNAFIERAREMGVFIVHAPSSTMEYYKEHPARKRAMEAPAAARLPEGIEGWCHWIDDVEKNAPYPIDQSDGGCACEPKCEQGSPWRKQIETIEIQDGDAISDSGVEVWNLFEQRGVENVFMMGVHTNMCVLGRPFGLRNMARFGKNVVLVRDLTDTMYNPRMPPRVNHFIGTDLIVEHIEKYVCPTATSTVLTGKPFFRFEEDRRTRVAFIIAENEYRADQRLPELGRELEEKHGMACDFCIGISKAQGPERHNIAGMEALDRADLAVLFVRRRALPAGQMHRFKAYLSSGKPLLGLRTASHAFDPKGKVPAGTVFTTQGEVPALLDDWPAFDREVLGCWYQGHHGHNPEGTKVRLVPGMEGHPILTGVKLEGFTSPSWLYRSRPLAPACRVLLTGGIPGQPLEPVLWTNTYQGSRIVYTSLGHWDDFEIGDFRRILVNAVLWLSSKDADR